MWYKLDDIESKLEDGKDYSCMDSKKFIHKSTYSGGKFRSKIYGLLNIIGVWYK